MKEIWKSPNILFQRERILHFMMKTVHCTSHPHMVIKNTYNMQKIHMLIKITLNAGHLKIVKFLTKNPNYINAKNKEGSTALHYASKNGD